MISATCPMRSIRSIWVLPLRGLVANVACDHAVHRCGAKAVTGARLLTFSPIAEALGRLEQAGHEREHCKTLGLVADSCTASARICARAGMAAQDAGRPCP